MDEKPEFTVRIENYSKSDARILPSYCTPCGGCIYDEDEEMACIMRKCIYALDGLEVYDRYQAKRGKGWKKDLAKGEQRC